MLKEVADMIQEGKDMHIKDLDAKKKVFDSHGQLSNLSSNKDLFMASFFKLYSDPDCENDESINKLYSFEDFLCMSTSDLENKVFVKSLCPDNLKLDDELVL